MTHVDWQSVEALLDQQADAFAADLAEFCAIPSEAGNQAALDEAAAWIGDRLARSGATTRVLHDGAAPALVVGEVGPGRDGGGAGGPTRVINAVQHYDVQPAGDVAGWTSAPYAPQVRDGRLYARGASDNKGELLLRVWAAEAFQRAVGELPCRVRFLVEGEEETGSQNLAGLLAQDPQLLVADGALGEAGGVDEEGRPMVDAGVRGMLYVRLRVRTLARDGHSGGATLLPNAAARLAGALGTLTKPDGAPAWAGLYAGVVPLASSARDAVRAMPLDLLQQIRREFNVTRLVDGLDGYEALEADLARPTCNIQAVASGDVTPSGRNIVPAEAWARIDMRLVPEQDPDEIRALLRTHLDEGGFGDVEIEDVGPPARAYWTDLDDPLVEAAKRAVEDSFGKPAIMLPSMAGTAPMFEACHPHRVPMVMIGSADLANNAHAPDESMSLAAARTAAMAFLRFLVNVAAKERVAGRGYS